MSGVIHVVTGLERGGAQRVALEIAAQLHDPGRPQLLVTGPRVVDGIDDEAEQRLHTRLFRLPDLMRQPSPFHDVAAVLALVRFIDAQRDHLGGPIVVHTHTSKAGVVGRLAARAVRGVYGVHTVHGFGLDALGPRRRWALEAAERVSGVCDVAIFVSEGDRATAARLGLYQRAQQRVIRAGIDAPSFVGIVDPQQRSAARARFGIPPNAPVVATIANLKPQKDPRFHVEVLAAFRRLRPDAHLLFAGDGPLRAEVERHARDLGVADGVHLLGFLDDPRPVLSAADAYLLASAWEGLPCSVLEATAAGLACVVRDTGWAPDLALSKSIVALPLAAPATAFASALDDVMRKPPKVKKVPQEFTRAGMLGALGELYDELIGPPRPSERERQRIVTARQRGRRHRR